MPTIVVVKTFNRRVEEVAEELARRRRFRRRWGVGGWPPRELTSRSLSGSATVDVAAAVDPAASLVRRRRQELSHGPDQARRDEKGLQHVRFHDCLPSMHAHGRA
jgi:hypothetical protein